MPLVISARRSRPIRNSRWAMCCADISTCWPTTRLTSRAPPRRWARRVTMPSARPRARLPTSRRWRAGSTAISTACSRSGAASSPTIRMTCWPSACTFQRLLARPAGHHAGRGRALFPHWSAELPGWGMILSCRCFAHEEAGNYTLAEGAGRRRSRSIPATCGARTPSPMCSRCRAGGAKASTG